MAEVNYSLIFGVIFGIVGVVTAAWGIVMRMFWASFNKHKESVQYKDNCAIQVKSFEDKLDSQKELMETKFGNIEKNMGEIKELIKNDGHSKPRVQT